jgi:hypothetical protein
MQQRYTAWGLGQEGRLSTCAALHLLTLEYLSVWHCSAR